MKGRKKQQWKIVKSIHSAISRNASVEMQPQRSAFIQNAKAKRTRVQLRRNNCMQNGNTSTNKKVSKY